jgi:ribosomal protein S20
LNGFEKLMRTRTCVALCFGLTVGLGGCRHKAQVAILPAVLTPVALEDIPAPENLPMVEGQPANLPPVPVVASAGKPKRERKKPVPKAAPSPEPVQIAAAAPPPSPEETAIGALTAGGEANPQTKQEAADLITSSEKRLTALPTQKAEEEKAQVSKVKNFLKDAQEALNTGDAEGAKTLATKAKLLLDDLEK